MMRHLKDEFDSVINYKDKKSGKSAKCRDVDFERLRVKQLEKRRDKNRHSKQQDNF